METANFGDFGFAFLLYGLFEPTPLFPKGNLQSQLDVSVDLNSFDWGESGHKGIRKLSAMQSFHCLGCRKDRLSKLPTPCEVLPYLDL
jgi:hypothetical protein